MTWSWSFEQGFNQSSRDIFWPFFHDQAEYEVYISPMVDRLNIDMVEYWYGWSDRNSVIITEWYGGPRFWSGSWSGINWFGPVHLKNGQKYIFGPEQLWTDLIISPDQNAMSHIIWLICLWLFSFKQIELTQIIWVQWSCNIKPIKFDWTVLFEFNFSFRGLWPYY